MLLGHGLYVEQSQAVPFYIMQVAGGDTVEFVE